MGEICFLWIGISHNPSNKFLVPCSTTESSLTATNLVLFKRMVQLSSANCPRDIRDELFNPGIIDAFFACVDNSGDRGIVPSSSDVIFELSGKVTVGP